MPPYRKDTAQPAQPRIIVSAPRCEWCNVASTFKCKGCGKRTCFRCLVNYEFGLCTHRRVVPVDTTGWGIPCPNKDCDKNCNLCKGRGVIWDTKLIKLYSPSSVREAP